MDTNCLVRFENYAPYKENNTPFTGLLLRFCYRRLKPRASADFPGPVHGEGLSYERGGEVLLSKCKLQNFIPIHRVLKTSKSFYL